MHTNKKKTYTAPRSAAFALHAEGMMAASVRIGDGGGGTKTVTDDSQVRSNEGSWNSGLWGEMDE